MTALVTEPVRVAATEFAYQFGELALRASTPLVRRGVRFAVWVIGERVKRQAGAR